MRYVSLFSGVEAASVAWGPLGWEPMAFSEIEPFIRRINDRTASALASVKQHKSIHFAWDGHHQDRFIEPALETLRDNGLKGWRFMFYVLVGFNTSMEYDLHRIYTLRDLGTNPFVMPYDKADPYQPHLARGCNNKAVFKTTQRFEDYEPWKRHKEEA